MKLCFYVASRPFWLRLSVVLDFFQRLVDRKVCNESYDTVSVGFFSRYDIISVLVRGKNYMFNSYF